MVAQYDRPDARAYLPRISVPTLIVRGAESKLLTAPVARRMRSPTAGSWTWTAEGTGAHLESPDAYQRAVLDFLG